MVQLEYVLKVIDTGDVIRQSKLPKSKPKQLRTWQKLVQRRILKDKRIKEEYKQAIMTGNVIAAWCNFDDIKAAGEDIRSIHSFVFNGYDTYFDSYYKGN